nr:tetratricopeptide repeat protein 4 homolog isoform X2 [Ziziphus jujuba var. spinosa]
MVKPKEDTNKKLKKIPESESFDRMLAEIKAITSDKDEQMKLLEERVVTEFIHYCSQKSKEKKASSSSLPEKPGCSSTTSLKNSATGKQQLEEKRSSWKLIDLNKLEHEKKQLNVQDSIAAAEEAKELLSVIVKRGYKIGKPMLREITRSRKPVWDKNKNNIHWPVLLLFPEVMACDFIEDFCDTDMFSSHLDIMFSEIHLPQLLDKQNNYTREAVEVYYEAKEEDASEDSDSGISADKGSSRWVKINEKSTLEDVLKQPDFVIQGIPAFYVVSKISKFYNEFKAGNWIPHHE